MLSESDMTYERRTAHVRTYNWPPFYLNLWIFVMLLASGSIMGVFSIFIQTQERLELGIPWSVPLSPFHRDQHRNTDSENRYFPYFIAVGAHTVVFIFGLFWLIYNRRLLPAIVMIGAFMLFILWMVGLVVTSVELWGPSGSVNGVCNMQVFNKNPTGASEATLAWMQQKNICKFSRGLVRVCSWLTYRDGRRIVALGVRHGSGRGRFPRLDYDHVLPSLCQVMTRPLRLIEGVGDACRIFFDDRGGLRDL